MSRLIVYPQTPSIVAHTDGVRARVLAEGVVIAERATALLSAHRETGNHDIELEAGDVDAHVHLVGRDPAAVELGRGPNAEGHEAMRGLHILTRAAGL